MFTAMRVTGYRSFEDSDRLPLSSVTVIIGRNNTGKSTLVRAIYQVQEGAPWSDADVRLGHEIAAVELDYDRLNASILGVPVVADEWANCRIRITHQAKEQARVALIDPQQQRNDLDFPLISSQEPDNLIYPSLTGRRSWGAEEQVQLQATTAIHFTDHNLVSRASTVINPGTADGREFDRLCRRVLGLSVSLMTSANGQRLGRAIDRRRTIGLDAMGTGVGSIVGLLINLTGAHGKVFLLEEPENDLHPGALKALLDVIAEKSVDNQFIVSSHSGVVLTRLASIANATVLCTESSEPEIGELPTSKVSAVVGREARLGVLRNLGYGLADLALGEGWLIFEESSAERLCRQYLIPWFVPELATLNTVAAAGAQRLGTLTQNLFEMTLYAHLEPAYQQRLWVLADGDKAGIQAITALRQQFPSWPADRFTFWDQPSLEKYLPGCFSVEAERIAQLAHDQRREPKRILFNSVIEWITADESSARAELAISAAGMIAILRDVAAQLRGTRAT